MKTTNQNTIEAKINLYSSKTVYLNAGIAFPNDFTPEVKIIGYTPRFETLQVVVLSNLRKLNVSKESLIVR